MVPAINYQKSQLIPSPSVILPSSLSTVFKTRVPGLTPICLCTFTLVRSARLFMACTKFAKLGNSLVLSPRRLFSVHAYVTSHLDYCNSLLFRVPKYQTDRLQKVFKAAARLIFRIPKFDHISSALSHLHWLPVTYRVHFKLLLLVYKSLNNQGPQYLQQYLQPHSISSHHPRSCDQGLLKILRTNFKTFGDYAFARSGPLLWNKLPLEIRNSQSVAIFKSKLKTHLFKLAYNLF